MGDDTCSGCAERGIDGRLTDSLQASGCIIGAWLEDVRWVEERHFSAEKTAVVGVSSYLVVTLDVLPLLGLELLATML